MNEIYHCMKALLITIFCLPSIYSHCQYFYNDVVLPRQSIKQYIALKNNHIKHVIATSYESDGTISDNFKMEQEVTTNATAIVSYYTFPSSGNTVTTNFYENNKPTSTIDSSNKVTTTSYYTYDNLGNILAINIKTEDVFMGSHSEELHEWKYNDSKPTRMLKINNLTDTTVVEFSYDEQGNVAQEKWKRKGQIVESYFYYYNTANQLTDIVRFNVKAKKMLPDFLLEYNKDNQLTQMTQIPIGSSDYLVWKYVYAANGLKEREVCFDKKNQLLGRIEYHYQQ